MNRFRKGILPGVLASLLIASMFFAMSGLFVPAPSDNHGLATWLRGNLSDVKGEAVDRAIDRILESSTGSAREGLLLFSRTLIELDREAAEDLSGAADTSPEQLARAISDRFGRMISDAMIPRHVLSASQNAPLPTSHRIDGLLGVAISDRLEVILDSGVHKAVASVSRVAVRILSSARPLGP